MTILSSARLGAELHCLSHDATVVLTAQRWSDPGAAASRPRSWLRLVGNGRPVKGREHQFTGARSHRELEGFWADLVRMYEPTLLTEDQMWAALKEITGLLRPSCRRSECGAGMPVAWTVCQACGRNASRVAGGMMTARRGRPDIMLGPGAFAGPKDAS